MKATLALIRRHPVVSYFVLGYAISWGVWVPMALTHVVVRQGYPWPTHTSGLLGPIIAAFVVTALTQGRDGIANLLGRMIRWRMRLRWYLVALSPLLLFGLAAVAMAVSGQGWPRLNELDKFSGLPALGVLGMLLLLIGNGYAEETGWRGYALPQLQRKRSALTASLIIGVLWALWHVPSVFVIQNYRELGPTSCLPSSWES